MLATLPDPNLSGTNCETQNIPLDLYYLSHFLTKFNFCVYRTETNLLTWTPPPELTPPELTAEREPNSDADAHIMHNDTEAGYLSW